MGAALQLAVVEWSIKRREATTRVIGSDKRASAPNTPVASPQPKSSFRFSAREMSVARLVLRLAVAALALAVLAASHAPSAALLVAALSTRVVQLTLAYFLTVALLAAHPRPAKQPLLDLLRLLLAFPFYCGTILFDSCVWPTAWSNPLLGFPRDTAAMLRRPRWFFALLKASAHPNNALPADADLVDMVPFGTVEEEPDKNATIAKFLITYRTGGTTEEVRHVVRCEPTNSTNK